MKIIFFGLGSIGQRHLRLLCESYDFDVLAFRTNKGHEPVDIDVRTVMTWEEVKAEKPSVAFITNPSRLHIETAIKCAELGMHLFIEKPLDVSETGLSQLKGLVRSKNLTTYVAFCMRFQLALRALKAALKGEHVLHARIICASYFPDWRPNQDHLHSYTAQQAESGGIMFELAHELDYATYLFGDIDKISGSIGRVSDVTVDADDFADLLLCHETISCNIHLNLFSRKFQRRIEVDTSDKHFVCDLADGSLVEHAAEDKVRQQKFECERDDMFTAQLKYFFENIDNPHMDNNLFDASVLFERMLQFRSSV